MQGRRGRSRGAVVGGDNMSGRGTANGRGGRYGQGLRGPTMGGPRER